MTTDTSTREFVAVPREVLIDIRDNGLIYWMPQTERGSVARTEMVNSINLALSTVPAAPGNVKMPETADEAALMALLGHNWLEQNAPERLKAPAAPVAGEDAMAIALKPFVEYGNTLRGQRVRHDAVLIELWDHKITGQNFIDLADASANPSPALSRGQILEEATSDELLYADMDHETNIAAMIDAPTPAPPRIDAKPRIYELKKKALELGQGDYDTWPTEQRLGFDCGVAVAEWPMPPVMDYAPLRELLDVFKSKLKQVMEYRAETDDDTPSRVHARSIALGRIQQLEQDIFLLRAALHAVFPAGEG